MEQDWNHFWTGAFLVISTVGTWSWAVMRGATLTRRRKLLGWWTVAFVACLVVAALGESHHVV